VAYAEAGVAKVTPRAIHLAADILIFTSSDTNLKPAADQVDRESKPDVFVGCISRRDELVRDNIDLPQIGLSSS
jgi:hypothetical protein